MNNLGFTDWRERIENKSWNGLWITIYEDFKDETEDRGIYSAIIPKDKIKKSLRKEAWDLLKGDGLPGFGELVQEKRTLYLRYGNFENYEPLVFYRYFHGVKETYIEISQEFIHYFELYHDKDSSSYIKILSDGNEEPVIKYTDNLVKVRLIYLKQYISVKKGFLALYFDLRRGSDYTLEELGLVDSSEVYKGLDYIYYIGISTKPIFFYRDLQKKSSSRLLGKKLIPCLKDFVPSIYSKDEESEYQEFIVGIDSEGKSIYKSCNHRGLGPNKYLQLVFFEKKVLKKYYDNPQKYQVRDNLIICGSLWGMPIDNNHEKYIIVFLGDLGMNLSNKEQMYWKSFNIPPDGKLSSTTMKRSLLAQFAGPERNDLLFKQKFTMFVKIWEKYYGWPLFIPLREEDDHYFTTLRIPLENNVLEFEQQVLALSKIIIESINQREIIKLIKDSPLGGINRLEFFLKDNCVVDFSDHIKIIRNLQDIRSKGIAHRKSKDYNKVSSTLEIGVKSYIEIFNEILGKMIEFLDLLIKTLL